MASQFKGVPDEYLEMFKAGIVTINASQYFEEAIREQVGKIRITRKAVTMTSGQAQMIDVPSYIINHGMKAVAEMKKVNNVVNQVFINRNGQDEVNCLAYTLGEIFSEISFLSIGDQEKVAQLVMELKRKSEQGFAVELNKAV